jgi:hypothetical protein
MRTHLIVCVLVMVVAQKPWPGPPKGGWALQPAALPKLKLGPENCIDMFGMGSTGGGNIGAKGLLDEQDAAGDPSSGIGQVNPSSDLMYGVSIDWDSPW